MTDLHDTKPSRWCARIVRVAICRCKRLSLFGLLVFGCGSAQGAARARKSAPNPDWQIRLHVDRGAWASDDTIRPLGVGVPFGQNQLRDPAALALQTDRYEPIPAVCEVRTRYADGSVQWLWIDFQAPPAPFYRLLPNGENPLPPRGIVVAETDDTVSVDNGVLHLLWHKQGVTPQRVTMFSGAATETLVAGADGSGVYVITADGERATMAGSGAELEWTVERANRLKVVLRVEGWYVREANAERVCRGRVRVHIHWQQPWLTMDHTFIVTRENTEATYAEIGVHWPLDTGQEGVARFGSDKAEPLAMNVSAADDAWIFQAAYPMYHRTESLYQAGSGSEVLAQGPVATGWCELRSQRAGLLVGVKDFAQQLPKELRASPGGVTAKLWSGRAGQILDYRPRTLVREWWGEWFDRIMETYNREGLPAALQDKGAWEDFSPSCVGVARSHELLVSFHAGPGPDPACAARFQAFQTEPLVLPDPRWTCQVGARTFWPMAAKGEGGQDYDDIERLICAWFDEHMIPMTTFPFTGWYDWGRTPVNRYAVEPSDDGARVWAQWFRIGIVNRYLFNKYLMIAWARSGERKYYEAASRLNRFIHDYYVVQWGERRGRFSQGAPWLMPVWGGGSLRPGVDSENMTGLALEYLFRGREACKDSLLLAQQALLPEFRADPAFAGTTPDMLMCGMIGIWRVTQDARLLEQIRHVFRVWTDIEAPAGISREYFGHFAPSHYSNTLYKLPRKAMAMVEYAQVLGNEQDWQLALKAARELAPRYRAGTAPISYCNVSGAVCGSMFLLDRDPELFETVTWQLQTARRQFAAYEQLSSTDRGLPRWLREGRSFAKSGYESRYAFPELKLLSNHKGRRGEDIHLGMDFSVDAAAAPFLSLPVAIGVLSGGRDGWIRAE